MVEGDRPGSAAPPAAKVRGIGVPAARLTRRRTAENALREAEARYRELFDNAVTGIAHVHADGRFIAVNPGWARVLGYADPEQYVAEVGNARNIYQDPAQRDAFVRGLTENGYVSGFEARLRHRDGSTVWVALDGRGITDEAGRLLEIHASGLDITERKRAEQTLRESEGRFRSIFLNSLDGILVVAEDAIVSANPAACRMLGRDEDELRRLGAAAVFDRTDARLTAGLHPPPGGPAHAEVRMLRPDGSTLPAEISSAAFLDAAGRTCLSMIVRDVNSSTPSPPETRGRAATGEGSDRRRVEDQMRRAKLEADAANRAKDEFLSRMSHELRTPLNAVLGFAQLLEMDATAEQRESVHQIRRAGRHLLNLINEVLDIAQIEAGRLTLSSESILVDELIDDVVRLMAPVAGSAGVELRVEPGGLANGHVRADRQRTRQVMLNLLSNGIKYNRRGGAVTVRCSAPHADTVRIAVADTGIGIAPADLDRLFTPFERLAAGNDVEGTGVGLALTQRLVDAMGGRILVESWPGAGSVFTVELPSGEATQLDDPTGVLLTPAQMPVAGGLPRRAKVLYIEDNPANARLVEQIVRRRPAWELLHAGQGALGLDLAAANGPDLVLLDLHLPDMPGVEVLRRLRAEPDLAGVSVVVITADANPAQAERVLAAGADTYLTKPIDVAALLDLLDETARRLEPGGRPASSRSPGPSTCRRRRSRWRGRRSRNVAAVAGGLDMSTVRPCLPTPTRATRSASPAWSTSGSSRGGRGACSTVRDSRRWTATSWSAC